MKRWLSVLTAVSLLFAAGCGANKPQDGDASESGKYLKITPEEAKAVIDGGSEFVLLDVRTAEEYAEAHIKGAMLIPDSELADRAESELPHKDAEILVYCRSGRRSAASAKLLIELGYTNVKDFGGIIDWPYETVSGTDPMGEEDVMQYYVDEIENVIYLAGGCFWGIEKLMESIPGVVDARSGYANGSGAEDANYKRVIKGDTGFRETVRVEYDPEKVSIDAILLAFFYVIDPTAVNRQGNDVGTQYQSGVYYTNDSTKAAVERIAAIEKGRTEGFAVEIGPLVNFFDAENYHQDYLVKNPGGYCHIPTAEIELFSKLVIDPGDYRRPADELIREKLSELQYSVTMENGTERAFSNEYWDFFEKGIYVDIVTGEPLFVSTDKFESGCGWPAFSKPIEEPAVVEKDDDSYGMRRTEVRSRAGDTHLGHVFTDDPESPNGVRYCINSASLRFVPYEKMEEEGYGYLLYLLES